jgi:uncharacterized protein
MAQPQQRSGALYRCTKTSAGILTMKEPMTNNKHLEHRNIKASKITLRKSASGNGRVLVGKIAYNSRSNDLGFYEQIARGAFTQSLRDNETLCYWAHDDKQILGRQSNGTLRLRDASDALHFECDLDPNTTWGANTIAALKRGDVVANSFGFSVNADGDEWSQLSDGSLLRTITSACLWECSPCGVPAYDSNKAYLRNLPAHLREKLRSKDDDDCDCDPDDEDCDCEDKENRDCQCDCYNCLHDNCEGCTDDECDDVDCDLCPAQSQRALVHILLKRRMHN